MNRMFLVLKNELIVTVRRASFLLSAVGIPLISTLILFAVSAFNRNNAGGASAVINQLVTGEAASASLAEGLVDASGLVKTIPDSVPPGRLLQYEDEAAARQALQQDEIRSYYLVAADYLHSGRVVYVSREYNPLGSFDESNFIEWLLKVNLVGGDEQLGSLIDVPLILEMISLAPTPQRDQAHPLTFFLPYAVTLIYYILILTSASFLLSSLAKEKENRVLEILMSAITPLELLTGKIVGLGLAGLLQTVLWVGTGFGLLRLSGQALALPAAFQLPLSFLAWGLLFFLLGYAIYASLMAAVGALVPNLREASQATFVVIIPLLVPLLLISVLIEQPDSGLAVGLSIFPLTAPVAMMTRLAATQVPIWQLLAAAMLQAATAALILRSVAGLFRAQTLLTGQPFQLKRFLQALAGRAAG